MKTLTTAVAVILSFSSVVHAWGDLGHKLVGEIAEQTIAPETKDFVRGILGLEPLAVAAVFPDQVRSDSRFSTRTDPANPETATNDFAPYHFASLPVGKGLEEARQKIEKDSYGVIKYAKDVLKNPKATRDMKMIVLRYLVHVVADTHQPLHVGNGFDRGANACKITWQESPGQKPVATSLHTFWDTTMVEYVAQSLAKPGVPNSAPLYYNQLFAALKAKHPEWMTAQAKKIAGSTPLADWYYESQKLREQIYPDNADAMKKVKRGEEYKNRPYCDWYADQDRDKAPALESKIDPSKVPMLDRQYAEKFRPLAEAQMFKAGLRLAYLLDQIAQEAKNDANTARITDKDENFILKAIHSFLKNR